MSLPAARALLQAHVDTLEAAVHAAHATLRSFPPVVRVSQGLRTRTSHLHDLVCDEIERRFDRVPSIAAYTKNQLRIVTFADRVQMRVHKGRRGRKGLLQHAWNRTMQTAMFDGQEMLLPAPGAVNVVMMYFEAESGEAIEEVIIGLSSPNGYVDEYFSLTVERQRAQVIDLPTGAGREERRSKVRPKKGAAKRDELGDGAAE